MKKIILVIALSFFCSVSFAQVEGVEVEKPKEETKKEEEKKKEKKSKDDDEEEMSLIDRFYFGGNLGASFGTITSVNASPMVGFRLTEKFSIGAGGSYQYWKDKRYIPAFTQSIYGWNVFSRYAIAEDFLNVGNLFAHVEYETLYAKVLYEDINKPGVLLERTKAFPSSFIGAGLAFPLGDRSAFTIMALYNPFFDQYNSVYSSALVIRTGLYF